MTRFGLVIDDDAPSRKIYGGMLKTLGFEIQESVDGEDALAALKSSQPDIIFLDLLLPKINGMQLLEYIYSAPHLQDSRVIIITAHTQYKYTVALRPGDAYFIKPVPTSEVREFIQRSVIQKP